MASTLVGSGFTQSGDIVWLRNVRDYTFTSVEFQPAGTNSLENVSETRVVFLFSSPPHDNVVLGVGASWEILNDGGHLGLENLASGMYSEGQTFKAVPSEWGPKGKKVETLIVSPANISNIQNITS